MVTKTGFKDDGGQTLLKLISKMERLNTLARIFGVVGAVFLIGMVALSTIDVVLRYFFNSPIQGTIEIIELTMVVLVFLSIGYAQATKSHVKVEALSKFLKPRGQLVLDSIACFNSIVLLLLVIWRSAVFAFKTPESTLSLGIPVTPFAILVPLGCTLLVLLFIRDYLEILTESLQVGLKLSVTILPVLVSIFIGAAIMLITSLDLDLPILGAIGLVVMMIFLLIGIPVGFGLMAVGFIFMSSMRGLDAGFEMLGHTWFRTVAHYPWAAASCFILMGFVSLQCRFGEDLFRAAYKWFGHMRGGLCIASIGAIAGFSAVSGDTLTGSVTMSSIALPEMRKQKYDDVLSIGTLTCAGTLGTLIPPSLGFIIYAILAEESVGDLFIAGVIPGIITAIAFMFLVYLRCLINPKLGSMSEKSTWKERFSSLSAAGPILAIFIFIIFGIFGGLFTPTEGGALGSSSAIVVALVMRRLDWNAFTKSVTEVARLSGLILTILGGAKMFGFFV
ncbi:MAG: TRAP transporter large permease subunit, partial [Deltaproteobacteria bacterium]|nr:TRAP transporter large permease subunit [Deltaproteobacteria bacterium]